MNIKRKQSKLIITEHEVSRLSEEDITNILSEYCSHEYNTESEIFEAIEFGDLPNLDEEEIQYLLTKPNIESINKKTLKPLLIHDQLQLLDKVTNTYLEHRLRQIGYANTVSGESDVAGVCPCCDYLSIDAGEDGLWDICPVCFWENGGEGPNHMPLAEAKKNFLESGAINQESLKFVDPDGPIKYSKKT